MPQEEYFHKENEVILRSVEVNSSSYSIQKHNNFKNKVKTRA